MMTRIWSSTLNQRRLNKMDEVGRLALTRFVARKMMGLKDALNGLLFMKGMDPLSDAELIEIARSALDLIERGEAL